MIGFLIVISWYGTTLVSYNKVVSYQEIIVKNGIINVLRHVFPIPNDT
jgi:hypothetical protein